MTEGIELLDDASFERVLVVVAHPDDAEYGLSACVAKWTAAGVDVAYLLLTSGEAGMQLPPAEVGPLRAEEQREACERVGVQDLEILDHPDGSLVYSLDLRRDVARKIREFKPDTVVTSSWEAVVSWGLNQADHRVAGLVTVDGVRDAGNQWVFPELAEAGLDKWNATRLLVYGHPQSTHGLELTEDHVQAGVRSLAAHEAYLADLDGHPAPEDFIPGMLSQQGQAMGCSYGMLFTVYQM